MSQEDYRRGLRLMTSIGRRSPPTSAPRMTFRETLAERGPRSMPRAGRRVTGDAIEQLWRSYRRGRHPIMRVVPINTRRGGHLQ